MEPTTSLQADTDRSGLRKDFMLDLKDKTQAAG